MKYSGNFSRKEDGKWKHESEGGELINVADAVNEKQFKYKIADGEKIGIVFPVYFYGLPTIVAEFMDRLTIESDGSPFVYTVITCITFCPINNVASISIFKNSSVEACVKTVVLCIMP